MAHLAQSAERKALNLVVVGSVGVLRGCPKPSFLNAKVRFSCAARNRWGNFPNSDANQNKKMRVPWLKPQQIPPSALAD